MGFAKDHLSDSTLADIARSLFTVKSEEQGGGRHELHGLCPIHDEKNPSFSYSIAKDVYHCLSCKADGDLVDLWIKVHGIADEKEGFKAFMQEFNLGDVSAGATPSKKKAAPAVPPPEVNTTTEVLTIDAAVWDKFPALPDSWIKRLAEKRGWSAEVIRELDLRQQTHYLDKEKRIVKKIQSKPQRIAMPVFGPDQKNLYNLRLYKPDAKKNKIISWGKGFGGSRLFPSPGLLKPGLPIILCEGESDTICGRSHGIENTITQTSKRKKWPKDHLKPFEGRDVIIAYDPDQAGIEYARAAGDNLHPVAKSVRIIEWPDYMGKLDDGTWPEKHGQDLTDFFVKHGRTLDDWQKLVDRAPKYNPENPAAPLPVEAREFFELNPDTGRWTYRPRWLANRILKDIPLMYDPKTGVLYKWGGRYWEEFFEDQVKKKCLLYLGDESKRDRITDAAFQALLMATMPHGREVNDNLDLVCINNGMLDLDKLELRKHQQDYYATYQLDVDFDPESEKKCLRWIQYLEETIQDEEQIMQAQEFAGYCLTRQTKYGKALFLLGPGNDGKSLFLKILRHMIGPQNCAATSFRDIEDQFYRSALYGKLLNISTEVGSKALESMYFKAIVTGDPISAAFKNRDPFEFTPFCKLAFAANRLPRVLDNSDGFYRRVLPIDFKRQFWGKADDKGLEKTLLGELSEIFVWSLVGLHRLWDQDSFSLCDHTDELMLGFKRLNNPILCFVEECCILPIEDDDPAVYQVEKDTLYKRYTKYCRQSGYTQMHKANFFRELRTAISSLQDCRPTIAGKRERCLLGIKLDETIDDQDLDE